MMMLIFFTLFFNLLFLMANHPLVMGLILLLQTLMIALITGLSLSSFWFSYILVLVFLGGMLILFIYVASMASNEKFSSFSIIPSMVIASVVCTLIFSLFFSTLSLKSSENETNYTFIWLYTEPMIMLLSFLIIYLFIVLVAIVKITKWWGGSVRPI